MAATETPSAFDYEAAVADFIVGFRFADIDEAAMSAVKAILKDQLALQVSAADLTWSQDARRFFERPRAGAATVAAEDTTMDPADAGYINATYGHGFEYDDVAANGHPGACVVPAAIAIGEETGATLGQMVEAMVTGYEVYVRIGRLAAPDLVNSGWHVHAVLSNFGAAAVAAKLYGFNAETTSHAMAIALSHASATTEYTKSGGSIKRVHAGLAVRNGIESARLARVGITGPKRYLTGPKGFYRAFIRRDVMLDDARKAFAPDEPLRIPGMWLKPYCCCGAVHAYIDALRMVSDRVDEISSIDVHVQAMTRTLSDNPVAQQNGTANIEELQFSMALQLGLAALGMGNGYATHRAFLDGKIDIGPDSPVTAFARKLNIIHAPRLDEKYPFNFVGEVDIHFTDGTSRNIFMDGAKGMPNRPFTPEQHREKLDELTFPVIGHENALSLYEMIDDLAPDTPLTSLTALLKVVSQTR
ncbi:MmgE/PrpD family protein [Paracoccus versutus]|uniref:2-methylcitrate dehydratase PrpD n=1 Tax=Paracoccus versutus TaxID=34007 RepID=A0A3D9XSA0_PARVE|nr:MmgE/PrpD family protein [Paracoccus versutus]REF73310.1 2-methylcitrate dehydratase PrpD [Paracoccus versutus]WGR54666.1 MmgE/PrpD family protein [Paracoccus versutus]